MGYDTAARLELNAPDADEVSVDGPAPVSTAPVQSFASEAAPGWQDGTVEEPSGTGRRLGEVLDLVGWVLAPTSLVTGALYWAGRNRSQAFWESFGVDQALLEFSTTDYVVRAVDTWFPLLVVVAVGTLVARHFHRLVERRLCNRTRMWCLQSLKGALLIVGLASAAITAAVLFPAHMFWLDPVGLGQHSPLLPPVLGLIATASLGYAAYLGGHHEISGDGSIRLHAPARLALAALTLLTILWVFWLVEQWAFIRGEESAASARGYPTLVFSSAPLQLNVSDKDIHDFGPSTDGYRYRYSGLSLLRYSNGRYFLLNAEDHRVVILKESDQLRFEFLAPPDDPSVHRSQGR